jgi:predicted permease
MTARDPDAPPRLAERLLLVATRDHWTDVAAGDLREEFEARRATAGPRAARRWYYRQCALLIVSFWTRAARRRLAAASLEGLSPRSLVQDARYAVRSLARRPRSVIAAAGLLALAIGLATGMFTIVDALVLRPVPFTEPGQLASLTGRGGVTGAVFQVWKASPVFAGVESASSRAALVATDAGDVRVSVTGTTPGIFDLLGGVRPIRGRLFDPEDGQPGREDRALVSEEIWRNRFGADPAFVGRTIVIDNQPLLVVGILPASFHFPRWNTLIWTPRQIAASDLSPTVYVRFAPGVPGDDALRLATSLADAAQPRAAGYQLTARPLGADLDPFYARAMPFLSGGVVLLFVVLCANAGNLRLASLAGRSQEFGTLTALGASRSRLVRQTMFESALIGGAGCAAGLGLAWALVAMARAGLPGAARLHSLAPFAIDERALLVTSIAGLVAILAVGLMPALMSTGVDAGRLLQIARGGTDQPRVRRVTRALLIGQFALSCMLVIGAVLLARSFVSLVRADRGFDPGHVLVADFELDKRVAPAPEALNAAAQAVEDAARMLPGIRSATWTYGTPPYGGVTSTAEWLPETPGAEPVTIRSYMFVVSPDFFETFGVPILRGGMFDASDPTSILIAGRLAQVLWPGQDPVGRQVRFAAVGEGGEGRAGAARDAATLTVAGVVRDLHFPSLDPRADAPQFYRRYQPGGVRRMLSLGCDGPCPNPSLVWRRAAEAHPAVRVVGVRSLDAEYTAEFVRPRAASVLALVLAVAALVASAAGLFGLLSQSVSRRRREFGIRAALGATPAEVRRLVWRDSLTVALAGTALGWIGGAWLAYALSSFLFRMSPLDPVSMVVVAAVLTCAVAAASWAPVRGAGRSSPVTLLREE